MKEQNTTVVSGQFGGRPYPQIADLVDDLNAVFSKYDG